MMAKVKETSALSCSLGKEDGLVYGQFNGGTYKSQDLEGAALSNFSKVSNFGKVSEISTFTIHTRNKFILKGGMGNAKIAV